MEGEACTGGGVLVQRRRGEACTGGGIQEVVWSLTGGGKGSPCLVYIGGAGWIDMGV